MIVSLAALPEIVVLCMLGLILIVDLFLKESQRIVTYALVQATVVVSFFITVYQYRQAVSAEVIFNGHYVLDHFSLLIKMLLLVASFFAFVYGREYTKERHIGRGDYYLLGLLAVLGMQIMASA